MTRATAVVDTGPLVLLLENVDDPSHEASRPLRRAQNEETLHDYAKRARLVVPTPVIAELGREGSGLGKLRDQVVRRLAHVRTEPLTATAADIAGKMRQAVLAQRGKDRERGAISYDALIAAIAHVTGARWLLTANAKHMQTCLNVVKSTVEVVDTTESPKGKQLPLVVSAPQPPLPPKPAKKRTPKK